jgi:predicted dehydrogenase
MDKLKIGVAGIGNMGAAHAGSILAGNVGKMALTAVCDVSRTKLEWARARMPGVAAYGSHGEMFEKAGIDAVIIATPHYSHPPIAIDAFRAGIGVLTEKPIGVSVSAAEGMVAAAKAAGKPFGIMYNQRTEPIFAAAREFVLSGRLGAPKRLNWTVTNWYRTQRYYDSGSWRATWAGEGGGALINQCVHNLDLWQWIFGMPKTVRGYCKYGKYHDIEVEDDVTVYAEYENGATAVFVTSTGECPGTNRLEISGDRAKMVLENGALKVWELSVPEREFCFSDRSNFAMPEIAYYESNADSDFSIAAGAGSDTGSGRGVGSDTGSGTGAGSGRGAGSDTGSGTGSGAGAGSGSRIGAGAGSGIGAGANAGAVIGGGHNGILRDFANAALYGTPMLAPGEEGVNALALINAIYLSDWTRSDVTLPIDMELFDRLLAARRGATAPRRASDAAGLAPDGDWGAHSKRWAVRW